MTSARLFTAAILVLVGIRVVVFVVFLATPRSNRVTTFWIANRRATVGAVSVYDWGAKSIVDIMPFRIASNIAVMAFFGAGSCRSPSKRGQLVPLLNSQPFPTMMASKDRHFWGVVNAAESQLEARPHFVVVERERNGQVLGCAELTENNRVIKL
jgi:hypothetical protein